MATQTGMENLNEYIRRFSGNRKENIRRIIQLCSQIYKSTYCLCFTRARDEEVLWNAHSDSNKCIMISTTARKVSALVKQDNHTIKEVCYDLERSDMFRDFLENIDVTDESTSYFDRDEMFLHKRKCFSYEREVRLICSNYSDNKTGLLKYSIPRLEQFLDGVMVHPQADQSYVALVELLCDHFSVPFLGRSNIYEFTSLMGE